MRPKALEVIDRGARRAGRDRPRRRHFGAGSLRGPRLSIAQKTYPVEALKEDLKILWDMLEEGHGGLDRYTPASVLKKSFDAAGNGLTGPLTEFDFYSGSCRSSPRSRTGTRSLMPFSGGRRLPRRPARLLSLRAPLPEGQGLCLPEPELGHGHQGRRGAPGHRRDADQRTSSRRSFRSSRATPGSGPPAPAPRVSGHFRPAPGPSVRAAGVPPGPLPAAPGRRDQGDHGTGDHGGRHQPAPS